MASQALATLGTMTRTRVRRERTNFACSDCGAETPRWLGRCSECGEWNTISAVPVAGPDRPGWARGASRGNASADAAPVALEDDPIPIATVANSATGADSTGVGELDRVLGGGLVPGSVTVLGGEPGIGKSTLVLEMLGRMAAAGMTTLLVASEESAGQVRCRAERLGVLHDRLFVAAENELGAVLGAIDVVAPAVVAIDSIQAVADRDVTGAPGSVTQVRESALALVRMAKARGIATLIVGHVTKDGTLAGPRTLEHIVDTVLSFEGDRHHALRLLHVLKHRFGDTSELGLFEMTERGLVGVADPSAMFLTDRRPGAPGSLVAPLLEGTRPLLVEVQALVAPAAGQPRRTTQGLDSSRFSLLLAVLERRCRVKLAGLDVYASAAGGVRVSEAGADLAVALAVAGAHADVGFDPKVVALGEIGLGGEIRQVAHTPRRLAEAARLRFTRAIVPASTPDTPGMELIRVRDLGEALAAMDTVRFSGPEPGVAGRTISGDPPSPRSLEPVLSAP